MGSIHAPARGGTQIAVTVTVHPHACGEHLLGHKTDSMLAHYDYTEELERLGRYKDEVKTIDSIFN